MLLSLSTVSYRWYAANYSAAADDPAASKLENSEGWRAGKSGTVGSIGKRGVYLPTVGSDMVTVGGGVSKGTSIG